MPNKKISDLAAAANAALTDLYETEQGGISKKETLQQLVNVIFQQITMTDFNTAFGAPFNPGTFSVPITYTNGSKWAWISVACSVTVKDGAPNGLNQTLKAYIDQGGGLQPVNNITISTPDITVDMSFTMTLTFFVPPNKQFAVSSDDDSTWVSANVDNVVLFG